ncbi:peptide/nickel transport system ATP-binding protein/peptide/nickel transport system ATP-binding protein [Nonomuraea jiangxiensis]|uniref:Peptide/nickel transport system ATP-binding protein/peptide/nickel transport system ATP-binding protein n=1 Tax=Nonomuraea jiangxiensis TaxID=633440 RepID=A0A1G9EYJ5_9ACTN|nr:ABC transporter ATP-binding protein [Nonomuraea jiangxiensis]SDK81219.1 peptide/nickel transport system ATP-binding protein/peptide/nickel transport system ATP-binding protein [Nonomuraea jiangxiensis]
MEAANQPLLRLRDLSTDIALRRGTVHALDQVNLQVGQGETLGIVGESGSGKTMTVLSIMGLLPTGGHVVGGEILFDGRDLRGLEDKELRRVRGVEMGMVFQDPLTSLNPTLRIGAQVAEPLRVHQGVSKAEARERAIEILRRVGMPRPDKIVDDYPHQLSGGMRQRVVIAMALIRSPRLLIADEPTTALDVTTQRQILELIDDLREEFRMAVILVTHDLGVIAGRADRVAVMYAGRVVETATTAELFRSPRHRYTEALMRALPESAQPDSDGAGRLYSIPGLPPDLSRPLTGCRFAPRCQFATDECRTTDVGLTPDGSGTGHEFACLHPVTGPVTIAAASPSVRTASEVSDPLLTVRDLVKEYDAGGTGVRRTAGRVSAVAGVSFEVGPGETLGIVGESGCGKSTVGRIVAGLEAPTGGRIVLDGADLATLDRGARHRMHRQVQLMFQDSYAAMNPRMRIDSILTEPLEIQQVGDAGARRARVSELLDQVGLPRRALERYPHEFSGGQLQRIGLARSLALSPRLIVADEPVSALDVSVQAQVLNLMRDLQRDLGLSYVFISHDLSVVDYMADRIGVMYLGKLVEVGPAHQVVRAPRHPYTQALLDAVPTPDPGHAPSPDTTIRGELPSALNPPTGCRFRTRCPLAQDICATEPLLQGATHQVACHFPLREEPPAS